MALYRRAKSRYWWASIYRGDDQPRLRVSTRKTDRDEARMVEAALRRAVRGDVERAHVEALLAPLFPPEPVAGIRLAAAWEVFEGLPEVELAPETLRKMRTNWRRFVRWLGECWPSVETLADVTPQAAFGYADWLRDATNRRKTYNNYKNDVKTVFQRLLFRAGMERNPFANVANLRTTDSLHGRAFSVEEEGRILAQVRGDEWEGVCLVGLYTGLRLGDISRLRWEHVQGQELRIVPSKTERHKVAVVVPLHRRVRDWLAGWSQTSEYVFPRRESRHGQTNYADDFSRVLLAAEVEAHGAYLSFHCWRHTFRTRLAAAGVPQAIAQKLGGWTTDLSELYNHDLTSLARAIDALG